MTSFAISGASGQLGRLVVQSLRTLTTEPIVLLSRTPEALTGVASNIEPRFADFDHSGSLTDAMAGIDRLVMISTDTLSADGRRVRQHEAAIKAALGAGVRHIVYASILKAADSPLAALAADHAATEAMLEASAIDYSILRNAFYDDLALQTLDRAEGDGRFVHAAGTGAVAYVTRQQCAQAAAVAVSDGFAGRRVLDITGPESLTMPDLAALATVQRGRKYTAVPVSKEELVEHMNAASVPPESAAMLAWMDDGIAQGAMEPASPDFERLTGCKPPALAV